MSELENVSQVKLIEPIECPKVLKLLNSKLPRSKFMEQGKKTVCFVEQEHVDSTSFKIKSKKIRSEKVIALNDEPKEKESQKQIPKFIASRSTKNLPPLEKVNKTGRVLKETAGK